MCTQFEDQWRHQQVSPVKSACLQWEGYGGSANTAVEVMRNGSRTVWEMADGVVGMRGYGAVGIMEEGIMATVPAPMPCQTFEAQAIEGSDCITTVRCE